jgi:hypothetical protein
MGQRAEHQAVPRRHRRLQAQDRVTGEAGEQRLSLVGVETPASHRVSRQDADRPVSSERDRVLRRDGQRRQQPVGQIETVRHEPAEQPAVGLGVGSESVGCLVHRSVQHRCATALERMRQRHLGVNPFESVRIQRCVGGDLPERR